MGRFRHFVQQFDGTPPSEGEGIHPLIAGTGWQSAWDGQIAATQAELISNLNCDSSSQTWTDSPGANERYPVNCVSWYEAFAFCIWDGGRLSTEAEREYVTAGGSENRLHPWGQQPPDADLANYLGTDNSPFINVGSHPAGAGRWGQMDLVGSMWEWVFDFWEFDWYSGEGSTCDNCANTNPTSTRVTRGGAWSYYHPYLRAAARGDSTAPWWRCNRTGFRCARNP